MKICCQCKLLKSLSEFHKSAANLSGFQSRCKICRKDLDFQRRIRDPQKFKRAAAKSKRKSQYGMSDESFQKLLLEQGDACAICRETFQKTPNVDHDHKTNSVRGLLCQNCNFAIGLLKDSPSRLRAAAAYLDSTLDKPASDNVG